MRLTKIIARKYSRVTCIVFGIVLSFVVNTLFEPEKLKVDTKATVTAEQIKSKFSGWVISSYSSYPNQIPKYTFLDENGKLNKSELLAADGFVLIPRSSCEVNIIKGTENVTLYCI